MLFGAPIFGFWLPFIGRRAVPLNMDGSIVDTGEKDMKDEQGPLYVKPWVFEWLGVGFPLSASYVYDSRTHERVAPRFDRAG